MLLSRRSSRASLLIAILAIYIRAPPLSAIELGGKFGTKKLDNNDVDNNTNKDKEAAIEDARKLVNSLNDAATGTITTYEPGHGPKKTEAICDEILAKSLVVANEEKTALITEKAAVVKAAALLSDRIDELTKKLIEANDRVAATESALSDFEQTSQLNLNAAAKEADERILKANDASAEELERMKLNMSALKNATAAKVERIQKETEEKLKAKDDEIKTLREESREEIKRIRVENEEVKVKLIKLHQEDMEVFRQEAAERESMYESQMAEVKAAAESDIHQIKREMEHKIKEVIASVEAKAASEREKHSEMKKRLEDAIKAAEEKESKMNSNIAELTTASDILQNEVSFWKETHKSQGYCNATLIREDSMRIFSNALASTMDGFASSQKLLSDALHGQLKFVQDTSADVVLFIEKGLIPKVEKVMSEACEKALDAYNEATSKALVLYNDHVAATVNEKIVPVLDEHVFPVWNRKVAPLIDQGSEHVTPIIKTIEKETKRKMKKARAGIAPLLESCSSSFIVFAKKNNFFNKLPTWVSTQLTRAAEDGQWALDKLVYGYVLLVVVLFRSLIFRIVWFFCPLRFFFRQGKSAKNKDTSREGNKNAVTMKAKQNGTIKNGRKNAQVF